MALGCDEAFIPRRGYSTHFVPERRGSWDRWRRRSSWNEATTPNDPPSTLDGSIEDEGSNLSIGKRSLAHALVKVSTIVILDELLLLSTMRRITRFKTPSRPSSMTAQSYVSPTGCVLTPRTIVCVMDNENITEFCAPDVLHTQNGSFRAACERRAF
jgi:hypothetical protein